MKHESPRPRPVAEGREFITRRCRGALFGITLTLLLAGCPRGEPVRPPVVARPSPEMANAAAYVRAHKGEGTRGTVEGTEDEIVAKIAAGNVFRMERAAHAAFLSNPADERNFALAYYFYPSDSAARTEVEVLHASPILTRAELKTQEARNLAAFGLPGEVTTAGSVGIATFGPPGSGSELPQPWPSPVATSTPVAHATAPAVRAEAPPAPPPVTLSAGAGSLAAGAPQTTAYAVVIGIERYRDIPAAAGAGADVARYSALIGKTLGIPSDNVHVLADDHASKNDIENELAWLKDSVPPSGRAYFFYSGHGAPDPSTGTPYLVPYDADAKSIARTGIALSSVMASLQATRGKDALAVVDACFSGSGGRSVLPPGARPLVFVKEAAPMAKLALFTAATGAQISGPAANGNGGLFSQLVAEGLGSAQADVDGDGQISLSELQQWVKPRVQRQAKKDRRDQTPGLVLGVGAGKAEDFIVAYGVKR